MFIFYTWANFILKRTMICFNVLANGITLSNSSSRVLIWSLIQNSTRFYFRVFEQLLELRVEWLLSVGPRCVSFLSVRDPSIHWRDEWATVFCRPISRFSVFLGDSVPLLPLSSDIMAGNSPGLSEERCTALVLTTYECSFVSCWAP